MKLKAILSIGIACSLWTSGICQNAAKTQKETTLGKGFYVRFGTGYSFGAGKSGELDALGMPGQNYSGENDEGDKTFTQKRKAFSLGQGADLMIAAGYMFTPYIGIDISFSTVFGSPAKAVYKNSSYSHYDGGSALEVWKQNTEETIYKLGYTGFYLTPAIRLTVPMSGRFSLYSRIGIALPLYSAARYSVEENSYSYSRSEGTIIDNDITTSRNHSSRTSRLNAYFRPGFNAVLGVDIAIGKQLSVYAEVEAMVRSFAVKKATLIEYIDDGEDQLHRMDEEDRVTEYVRKIDQNTQGDPELSYNIPANSIGINIGIAYRF